jgi:hypothetical protein
MGPMPAPVQPAYVDGYKVGISQMWLEASLFRQPSYPDYPASTTQHTCDNINPSPDNPITSLATCQVTITSSDIVNHTFLHGDWFKVTAYANNGGYLNISNLDDNETTVHYYTGTPVTPFSLFVIDIYPPVHCSEILSVSCLSGQEIIDDSLLHNTLSLLWGGWNDDPSDVKSYKIEIGKLVYNPTSGLLEESSPLDHTSNINDDDSATYTTDYTLSMEGPYFVILIITDVAGNKEYARRIVINDQTSSLMEDDSIPLVVTSGYEEDGAYWHNSTTSPITISGERHFYNSNLKNSNWLAPVANHTPSVPPQYDDSERFGTPNALGITTLSYAYIIDNEGGESIAGTTIPGSFPHNTEDLALSDVPISPSPLTDGQSVSIWFEARDYRGNTPVYERVLVHVDSSPPSLSGLGLRKAGINELVYLFGSDNLLDLDVVFEAYDEHSGLYEINWVLETDTGDAIAQGTVPIVNFEQAECIVDDGCICDEVSHCHKIYHSIDISLADFMTSHVAAHDTDYFITITVLNHARLVTSLTRQFTVDLTSPLPGAVFEGPAGPGNIIDIDYTDSFQFPVRWTGFFDAETAILVYQYVISPDCVSADSFQYPKIGTGPAVDTNSTSVVWTAPATGTYHVTVVGYNGAFLPSSPVCSDGIVIDMTPPSFDGVVIPGTVVREGLVATPNGEVWLVNSKRQRSLVNNNNCINQSTPLTNGQLSSIPKDPSPINVSINQCASYSSFVDVIYTPVDYALNVTWVGSDDNGIRDYQIGVASSPNMTNSPDIISFRSTAGHPHFSIHHPQFLSGFEFYIVLKATDVAQHETLITIGPVIIDTTPPSVNGSLSTDIQNGLLIIHWDEDTFADHEDVFELHNYEYSIGRTKFGDDILPFTLVTLNASCPTPYCIFIATEAEGFLPGNQYHVTLKITNSGNLATIVPVDPYSMPYPLTSCLAVFEYDIIHGNPLLTGLDFFAQSVDVDITFDDNSSITVGWTGLSEPHFNATFMVAIGTSPGADDIITFTTANYNNYHTFYNLTLDYYQSYYTSVRASNDWNTVTASSDGFILLPSDDNDDAVIWDGWSNAKDIDYQLSSSTITVHWHYPYELSSYVSHYEWTAYEMINGSLVPLVDGYISNGKAYYGSLHVNLKRDAFYVSAFRACFGSYCLPLVYSDGFRLATPPIAGNLTAEYVGLDSGTFKLNLNWTPFQDPELEYYQWSMGSNDGGLLTYWSTIPPNTTSITTTINKALSLYSIYHVTLRGVNTAGLSSNVTNELTIIQGVFHHVQVFDIEPSFVTPLTTNDYRQLSFFDISYTDIDYSPYSTSLSASWPDLRYKVYTYSISTTRALAECPVLGGAYNVSSNSYCSTTIGNSITVTDLTLVDGLTYYFCVRGLAEDALDPSSSLTVTACSDGVVVDLAPPAGGCVQLVPMLVVDSLSVLSTNRELPIGADEVHSCVNESGSQSSTSELHIMWDWFQDVEQYGNGPYVYGVSNYEYAIGSFPGATDVVGFTSVGVINEIYITSLSLQHGRSYYATIKATDHTGKSTLITSLGIIIDTTPPETDRVWLGTPSTISITSLADVIPHWDMVVDEESGMISSLYWSIGSTNGSSDIHQWTPVTNSFTLSASIGNLTISDGQPLVLSILAINNVGLISAQSSNVVIFDASPPCIGRVFDGGRPIDGQAFDVEYSHDHTQIQAHWNSFSDPHTSVGRYYWAIGTCKGCTDVSPYTSVGLWTDSIRKLPGVHRQVYHVSVRGCSYYSGCTVSHSDGFIIDATGPITSLLHHGVQPQSLQFQPSRRTILCYWNGFYDSDSSLSHFTYYAGTAPGDHTYVPPTMVPSSINSFAFSSPFSNIGVELPINRTVYVTLEAHNRAGLSHTVSSKGVFITELPPNIVKDVSIDTDWSGSIITNTQYTNSYVTWDWNVTDLYSNVDQYFWRVWSEENSYIPTPPTFAYNSLSAGLSNFNSQDGGYISIIGNACSQAGLCIGTSSVPVLIDSTPPIAGYFAVNTTSMAEVPWTIPDGMSWYHTLPHSLLNITFTGFSDPHSGIREFWTIIGSHNGGQDLYTSSSPLVVSEHPSNSIVSTATVSLSRSLVVNEVVYIWLWAINNVGLESKMAIGSFRVRSDSSENGGQLELLRSGHCPIDSCLGHCTCGRLGYSCNTSIESTCQLVESSPVTISNIFAGGSSQFSVVTDKIVGLVQDTSESVQWAAAEWTVVNANGSSIGEWFPLGHSNRLILSIDPSDPLEQGAQYTFKMRVWYNFTHYSVVQSPGITIDTYNPNTIQGFQVLELSNRTSLDVDYISSTSHLTLDWSNVFWANLSSSTLTYQIGLGDTPGSDNVHNFFDVGYVTNYEFSGLNLKGNRKYFAVVRGTNELGLTAISVSDGFLVDLTPPKEGAIFNGHRLYDESAQSNIDSVSLRFVDFHDPESQIRNFEVGLAQHMDTPTTFTDVGIIVNPTIDKLNLTAGDAYESYVKIYNTAGRETTVISSRLNIDASPPNLYCLKETTNIITESSFESLPAGNQTLSGRWYSENKVIVRDAGDIEGFSGCDIALPDGIKALEIPPQSKIWQDITSIDECTNFCLSFDILAVNSAVPPFHVSISDCLNEPVDIEQKPPCKWIRKEFHCNRRSRGSSVRLSIYPTMAGMPIIIDDIKLTCCGDKYEDNLIRDPSFEEDRIGNITFSRNVKSMMVLLDPQSDISIFNSRYAIGTQPGGIQLSDYKSIGDNFISLADFEGLQHNTSIYVTIVATNYAGLTQTFYSPPFIIDKTPPEVKGIGIKEIVMADGHDIDYTRDTTIWYDWSDIVDEESGIDRCIWALGSSPGSSDIISWMETNATAANTTDLSSSLSHGVTLYGVVKCINNAGYSSSSSSDGVTFILQPPNHQLASLTILSPTLTWFESQFGYLPTESLQLVWNGFQDDSGAPLFYQVRIVRSGDHPDIHEGWEDVGELLQVTLNDVSVSTDIPHIAQIRAYVLIDHISEPVNATFTIVPMIPRWDTGESCLILYV